ncbi:MAG: 30S ribosomal protein S6 [Puniceicoccales bacterium]|jgi:small subunit ribosomal protein S6|nr:30S ribosomal protein S6 [Puniceicoccales bacterium]
MKNKKNYRASFILDMRGCSEPIDAIFTKLRGIVTDFGGDIREFKALGQKTFERAVNKRYLSGEYVQIAFGADSSAPTAIREKLRLDKTINRVFIENC